MRPTLPRLNSAYGVLSNTVFCGDHALQSVIVSNGNNLSIRKFMCDVPLTSVCRSTPDLVSMIIFRGIPAQIVKAVILHVSIVMAAFHAFWARANKRRQNESVRPENCYFVVSPKADIRTGIVHTYCQSLKFSSALGSYATKIRYFVDSLISCNVAPAFHKHLHMAGWYVPDMVMECQT